jgi:hypothetical protein
MQDQLVITVNCDTKQVELQLNMDFDATMETAVMPRAPQVAQCLVNYATTLAAMDHAALANESARLMAALLPSAPPPAPAPAPAEG